MGGAASIEHTPYDEAKFLQSKAILESTIDDAEKFYKLKSIWTDNVPLDDHKEEAYKKVAQEEPGKATFRDECTENKNDLAGERHLKEEESLLEKGLAEKERHDAQDAGEHDSVTMKAHHCKEGESTSKTNEHGDDVYVQQVETKKHAESSPRALSARASLPLSYDMPALQTSAPSSSNEALDEELLKNG